jgi:TonB family protein
MKPSILSVTVIAIFSAILVGAAIAAEEPKVALEPFEPSYKSGDKFSSPKEVVAPRFLWPFEMRRSAISGEVVVLVELDGRGRAKKLSVLSSTHPLFAKSAIEALKIARWESTTTDWFYYRAVFDITKEEPNQSLQPTAPSGRG